MSASFCVGLVVYAIVTRLILVAGVLVDLVDRRGRGDPSGSATRHTAVVVLPGIGECLLFILGICAWIWIQDHTGSWADKGLVALGDAWDRVRTPTWTRLRNAVDARVEAWVVARIAAEREGRDAET